LSFGVLVGFCGEAVDLVWLGQVAEALGGFAEQVGRVDEPCPFWFVFRHDVLECLFGADDCLSGRCGVAEAGVCSCFEYLEVCQAGGLVVDGDSALAGAGEHERLLGVAE